jgi:hypothetical protein
LAAGRACAEFGTRRGISTCAILAGRPRSLICYDLVREPDLVLHERWAQDHGITFGFVVRDLRTVRAVPSVDFLFIDAMHNGIDVTHYLLLGEKAGMRACALHDTTMFRDHGDVEGSPGIGIAIATFLECNPDWRITYQTDESYGLTVLERP